MWSMFQVEWYKLRKSKVIWIVFAGPLISLLIGLLAQQGDLQVNLNQWFQPLFWMNFSYTLLFLPLVTGVLASIICRYEHQADGWKQLLALPVSRVSVFTAKFSLLLIVAWIIQVLYILAVWLVGTIKGFTDPFPKEIIWKALFGGWLATFPLIALQFWLSLLCRNFAVPFAVNVFFTLPAILAANSERFGPYYPWAQPFLMMVVGAEQGDPFYVPWDQLGMVVGGSFLLFLIVGYWYFQRKEV